MLNLWALVNLVVAPGASASPPPPHTHHGQKIPGIIRFLEGSEKSYANASLLS